MTATLQRDPLMPPGLDHDGMVCWYALGEIAAVNAYRHWTRITSMVAAAWGDDDWAELAATSGHLTEPITAGQQALIIATLWDLERRDRDEDTRWWNR